MSDDKNLVPIEFDNHEIRRIWDEETETWWFSVIDVVGALSESSNPSVYWSQLKRREKTSIGQEPFTFCKRLKMPAADGKMRLTDCADTEGVFRIIQSIPSPKAEPFKQWLARVGYERLQETENPELAAQRVREIYRAKGYSEEWIERRLQSIATRNELTEEWKRRGVQEGQEYAFLTADIARETFGVTPSDHKKIKQLKRENLRDHMTGLELAFTILGEAATTEIAREDDAQGFPQNRQAARKGGKIAGDARKALEVETGRPVVSPSNYLEQPESGALLESGDEEE